MALWSVDIEKQLGTEFWTNRYIVEAETLAAAADIGDDIKEIERNTHKADVTITRYRVSDMVPGTDNFTIVPVNQVGVRTAAIDRLPLFNVVRVDFAVAGGRPSRKYLRLPLGEAEQTNGDLTTAMLTQVNDSYAAPLVALAGYVDVDGQEIIGSSVSIPVGMRQLRRGSRRRTEPVL